MVNCRVAVRRTLAGAVAREIERGGDGSLAYKAYFDEIGSGYEKHIESRRMDDVIMRSLTYDFKPRRTVSGNLT